MEERPRDRATPVHPFSREGLAAVCAALALSCGRPSPQPAAPRPLNEAAGVAYLGIGDCVGCHKDKAATYAHTGMGRSFYPMTPAVAVEDFTTHNTIEVPHQGVRYRMTRRGDRFFMAQSVPDASGGDSATDERELAFVIGSGNHSRSYVTLQNGQLFQAPVCWYPEAGAWDLCPGYEEKNDHFSREISETCVFCHNARMEPVPGSRARYREPLPAGIDCERCHGPGALHVARWREGKDEPTGGADPTIVNPRRLPAATRIQVCFQCHLGDSKATERVARHERELADFRPGHPVSEVMVPFYVDPPSREHFGISAQADRFLRSRCYTQSGGRIECLTCHDPHVSVYGAERPRSFFRDKCLGCHRQEDCTGPAAERQATARLADDCLACHMRKEAPDDHAHASFTDHWIRKASEFGARSVRETASARLVPVFPEAYAQLPAQEQQYYLGRAYFLKALDFPPAVRNAMWRTGEDALRSAIGKGFDTADAWFFLGKLLGYEARWKEAASALREAVTRDPEHHDATLALGTALAQEERFSEASSVFARMLERWPEDPGALAEEGRCAAALGQFDEALALYARAAAGEPQNASFHSNRGVVLSALGRHAEAAEACRDALRLDPGAAGPWKVCAEVLEAAGKREDAGWLTRRGALLVSGRSPGKM